MDTQLGPEMKSTGEVLGIASTLDEALYKGLLAAGYNMKKRGGVLVTVRDVGQAGDRRYRQAVFMSWASPCMPPRVPRRVLESANVPVQVIGKIHESGDQSADPY